MAVLTFVLVGVASATTITVTASVNGHKISLHRGDLLVVALHGNLSTGYVWETQSFDRSVLRRLSTQYVPDSDKIGAGETSKFRFAAQQPGKTTLRLVYRGPSPGAPTQRFTLYVAVD